MDEHLVLSRKHSESSRSMILRSELSLRLCNLGWSGRQIGSGSGKVCFRDVALPDKGVSALMLPNEQDKEGDVVEEH